MRRHLLHCPHCQQPIRQVRGPTFWQAWGVLVLASVILFGSFGYSASRDYLGVSAWHQWTRQYERRLARCEAQIREPLVAPSPRPERKKWRR